MAGALWSADFEFRRDHLRVKKTGARVPYAVATLKEVADWYVFFLAIQLLRALNGLAGRRGPRLLFAPDAPRPWYLVWAVARAAGCRFAPRVEEADAAFFFEDATRSAPPALAPPDRVRRINFACGDVSKSRVAAVFEEVFGYPLAVDPRTFRGTLVEKSEANGAHDGELVEGPLEPRPGKVYQRLVDTAREDGLVEDMRCPTVLGACDVVFLKRRPAADRFANANTEVALSSAGRCFSAEERGTLARFIRAMQLDWGGLDVLRDRRDGRLYVVDVNKTDMGPPTALPLSGKLRATRRLAAALRAGLGAQG